MTDQATNKRRRASQPAHARRLRHQQALIRQELRRLARSGSFNALQIKPMSVLARPALDGLLPGSLTSNEGGSDDYHPPQA